MIEKGEELIDILKDIKRLVDSPDTVLDWSNYSTVEEVLEDMDSLIERLNSCDTSSIKELKFLFAPTGSLQEISIDSGWSHRYLEIADKVDKLLK